MPVVHRQCLGRDSADNCGVPQLQVVYMSAVVHFFDKVVDVPVVLCDGVPQVQFIEGYDVPVIMRGQRSAPHLAD